MSVLPPLEAISTGGPKEFSIASVVTAVLAPASTTDIAATSAPTKTTLDFEPRLRLTGFETDLEPQAGTSAAGHEEKVTELITTLNQVHIATAVFGAVISMVQQIPDSFKRLMQG
ncbi:MAG: hypothetical protein ACO27F_07730 [Beijerinckiaceae bacterium]|jgi:hypothetical protein